MFDRRIDDNSSSTNNQNNAPKSMNRLSNPKTGSFILLLFLSAQVILPAFCCCGISTILGETASADTETSKACSNCISHQADDGVFNQISGTDNSHECPCKAGMAKQLITTTKATVQIELPLKYDAPIHDIAVLDLVADHSNIQPLRSGPPLPVRKHSQTSQSIICCWLC
ncbi:MAG: hypothetical protein CMM02_13225 [Rhodopirellula sp.]|jgi:hypothetical protein|nr:hypothetical protein [Rhodopirellula sp.]|tara:strand:+ start:117 stop:626 length:510 start_codon:yes stop_codon:yes gene_type:complete